MRNEFPRIEVPCFEDYYGESHKDAHPVQSPIAYNLKNPHDNDNCSSVVLVPPYSTWFSFDEINEIEMNALPQFFKNDVSLAHYKECRNILVNMFREQPGKLVSIIRARKRVNCDIVSLIKIHAFLEKWGLINYRINELKGIYKAKRNIKETITVVDGFRNTYFEAQKAVCQCGSVDRLYFTTKNEVFVCKNCLSKGEFDTKCTTDDFMPFNIIHAENLWSKKDELLLLNAIEKAEDWQTIGDIVGRTKEQCIMRFLNLDIKASSLEKNIALFDGSLLNTFSNPLMSFIALICGSVHPKIASDAAKWALSNLKERNSVPATLLALTVTKAEELKKIEDEKKEKLLKKLVELQIKKLELKMCEFEELCHSVKKERSEYTVARESYLKEYESLRRLYGNQKDY